MCCLIDKEGERARVPNPPPGYINGITTNIHCLASAHCGNDKEERDA